MITYKIYGHPSRIEMVHALQHTLDVSDDDVYLDDRPERGWCLYTAKKAWLSPMEDGETHRLAIPEDIEVCNNFKPIVERIVKAHPKAIISLFPYDYDCYTPAEFFDEGTPYIDSYVFSCCGTIMPVEYIKPCFEWIEKTFKDQIEDDIAIQRWGNINGVRLITTIPSTVQHIGDNSIVTPNAPIRRTQYFKKNMPDNIDWDTEKVAEAKIQRKKSPSELIMERRKLWLSKFRGTN